MLIKPFSSEAALLTLLASLPDPAPSPKASPASRHRQEFSSARGRQEEPKPLRHFSSLSLVPRRAIGRSPKPPGEAAGAHVAYDPPPTPATVHCSTPKHLRFGLKPRSASVGIMCCLVLYFLDGDSSFLVPCFGVSSNWSVEHVRHLFYSWSCNGGALGFSHFLLGQFFLVNGAWAPRSE